MTEYIRDEGPPAAADVEQRVENAVGRSVAGVVVDADGLQKVVLPGEETLTEGEYQSLTQEFGQSFSRRDRSPAANDGRVVGRPEEASADGTDTAGTTESSE